MTLSILIPVFWKHAERLILLENNIRGQMATFPDQVELLILENRGEKTIGKYRQLLLEMAASDYVVFIDADDQISDRYLSLVLEAINQNPDCVGITGTMTTNGISPATWEISKDIRAWSQTRRTGKIHYLRSTNHLAPIKRSIALKIGFTDMGHGEDYDYSVRLQRSRLLKKEVKIRVPIYNYDYQSAK
jgi:glycosyltransferase involved in cell wall biosynthesis